MKPVLFQVISPSGFRVLSSFFTDLAAAWFLASLASPDPITLTRRLVISTMSLYLAIILERSSKHA